MKSKTLFVYLAVALLVSIGFGGMAYAQAPMTVTGVLTEDFEIATDDGDVYDVAEDDVAIQMFEMPGSRVSVTGTLVDTDDGPMFKVNSYKILDE